MAVKYRQLSRDPSKSLQPESIPRQTHDLGELRRHDMDAIITMLPHHYTIGRLDGGIEWTKSSLIDFCRLFEVAVTTRITPSTVPMSCDTSCSDLDLTVGTLTLLALASLGLGTHDTTTPVTLGLLVLVHVAFLDGLDELGKLRLVFAADLGDGESGGSLESISKAHARKVAFD